MHSWLALPPAAAEILFKFLAAICAGIPVYVLRCAGVAALCAVAWCSAAAWPPLYPLLLGYLGPAGCRCATPACQLPLVAIGPQQHARHMHRDERFVCRAYPT